MYTGRGGHRTYFVDESNTWGGDTAQHRKMGGGHRTYFVDGRNNWGGDTAQNSKKKLSFVGCGGYVVGGRLRRLCGGGSVAEALWWVGGPSQRIMPLCGSILQAGTCQILTLAENPRWSRVWQSKFTNLCLKLFSLTSLNVTKWCLRYNFYPLSSKINIM